MRTYRTIDLFAGIGGIRRGFELTGRFENVLSSEIDKHACRTYEHLFGDNPYNDVTKEEFKAKVAGTGYDVLLGGFPCQAFSMVGKRMGFLDKTKGTLFFDVADILSRTRPMAFLLENVMGLFSHDEGRTFETILSVLIDELEYDIVGVNSMRGFFDCTYMYSSESIVRNTLDFGLPQYRNRVFLMGFDARRFGESLSRLPNRRLPRKRDRSPIYKSLASVMEKGVPSNYYVKSRRLKYIERKNGTFGKHILYPDKNAFSFTIMTMPHDQCIYDPGKDGRMYRWLTPTEYGRLQGFIGYGFVDENGVDHFSFPEGTKNAQKYKMFGNSVSIPVIEELARTMAGNLDFLCGCEADQAVDDASL